MKRVYQIPALAVLSSMALGNASAATPQFTWQKSGGFAEASSGYNSFTHQYRTNYAAPKANYGALDGCKSSVSDYAQPEYQWTIERRLPVGVGVSGTVLTPYWQSEWSKACYLLASGVSIGTVVGGAGSSPGGEGPSARPLRADGELFSPADLETLAASSGGGSTTQTETNFRRNDQARAVRKVFGVDEDLLRDIDSGANRPVPPPARNGLKLLGPAFDREGEYSVTLKIRDRGANRQVETTEIISIRTLTVALLGDSYASGEGNPDYDGQIAPLEVKMSTPIGLLLKAAGLGSGVPASNAAFSGATIDAGQKDALCKITKGIAWYLKDRIPAPYDRVPQKRVEDRHGLKMQSEPSWLDLSANRSLRSGHARAVETVSKELVARNGWTIRFLNFATSGAKTGNLTWWGQNYFQINNRFAYSAGETCGLCGQIAELADTVGKNRIDVLILSAGGNDVGFSDYLTQATLGLVSDRDLEVEVFGEKYVYENDQPEFLARLATVRDAYRLLNDRIVNDLNVGTVILTGYPTDLFSGRDGTTDKGCGIFEFDKIPGVSGVTRDEALLFRRWAEMLRAEQVGLAQRFGWTYVDVAPDFTGHGYCTGVNPGIANRCDLPNATFLRSAERSCVIQGNLQGTMHPNYCGHSVYEKRLLPLLRKALFPKPASPPAGVN